jgi:hypothetical protein
LVVQSFKAALVIFQGPAAQAILQAPLNAQAEIVAEDDLVTGRLIGLAD